MQEQITSTQIETQDIAKSVASTLQGGDIVLLHGDLGAGKTTFAKGLAEGLGVTDDIVSPTFTLMNIYTLPPNPSHLRQLVHVDTYRLKTEQELIDIGIEDYLGDPETICVIEWPEKIEGLLKDKKVKQVNFTHLKGDERRIEMV